MDCYPPQIYKKWLTVDLRETLSSCLPRGANSLVTQQMDITGPLTLQLVSVINVGASAYSQVRRDLLFSLGSCGSFILES